VTVLLSIQWRQPWLSRHSQHLCCFGSAWLSWSASRRTWSFNSMRKVKALPCCGRFRFLVEKQAPTSSSNIGSVGMGLLFPNSVFFVRCLIWGLLKACCADRFRGNWGTGACAWLCLFSHVALFNVCDAANFQLCCSVAFVASYAQLSFVERQVRAPSSWRFRSSEPEVLPSDLGFFNHVWNMKIWGF